MKTILITGASKGIGKALALKYTSSETKLLLVARDEQALIQLKNRIIEMNGNAEYYICDVRDKENIINVINSIYQNHDSIDLAILNAGISINHKFENFNSDVLINHYNTNLFGVMYFMEALLPKFKARRSGTISAVGSLAEARGIPGSAIYCSTKIALSHLLEAARIEMKEFGVKIISIKPGYIETEMTMKNKFKMPFLMTAEKSAEIIYEGIESGKRIIAFPKPMAFFSYIGKVAPAFIFESLISKWVLKHKSK
jgi:short-subunit dehydrogenase